MNKIFRVIWSRAKDKWVVVAEKVAAKSCCPAATVGALTLAALLASGGAAFALDPGALPTGGQITAGSGSIAGSGNQMTVNQTSGQMIANWDSFNIGANAGVQFNQPNSDATALNRINDQNPSQILGSLTANGKVFLLNPAGIIFGQSARVDVGGLVASSLDMLDSDFLAGTHNFSNTGSAGSILNQGAITTMPGGVAALIAPKVSNEGTITTPSGSTLLAAANQVSLDFKGDGLITYTIDQGAVDALAENKGLIKADGGLVVMTAKAADSLTQAVVNNSGVIAAQALESRGGRILLDGTDGMAISSGTLDASGKQAGEHGGTVMLLGNKVGLFDGARVDVSGASGGGTALIGGNWQGKGVEANAQRTYVADTAHIDASVTGNGDGGTVVVWADDVTRYYGSIVAQGGALGGNGGQVEVSGKKHLDFNGHVDTSAAQGQGGVLLLDPTNIVVATVDPGGGAVSRTVAADLDAFADNAAETSWITPANLVTLLNTAAVTLRAYNDITVSNAVDASGNVGNFGLTLYAGRSILLNDNIKLRGAFAAYANDTGGAGTNRGAGAGDFTMAPGKSIDTSSQNKSITIQVGTQDPAGGTATIKGLNSGVGAGISVKADSIDLSGGANSISGTGTVTLAPISSIRPVMIGAAGLATDFALDATELATLANGFSTINLGKNAGLNPVTISNSLSFNDPLIIYSNNTGGNITLDASARITTNGNNVHFSGGAGEAAIFTQAAGATISTGAGTLNIYSDVIKLQGAANSISSTGNLTLSPQTPTRNINIGADDAAGVFALNTTELASLADGFSSITIGSGGRGIATLSGPLSFNDRVNIYNYGDGGRITLDASATITTNGNIINFKAGSGDSGAFTQTNGAMLTAGAGGISICGDVVTLNGAADSISGSWTISLYPNTAARAMDVGTKDATKFSLNAAEILTLKDGFLSIGIGTNGATTGGLTLSAPLTFYDSLGLGLGTAGSFTVSATPTVTGVLQFVGARPVALNASVSATSGVAFGGAVTVGADNLSVNAGTGTATFSNTLAHDVNNFTVTADSVALSGNWSGTGTRTLQPTTTTQSIGLGVAGFFSLSTAELGYLNNDTPASVTIGRADGTGTITGSAFTFTRPLFLQGGTISQTGAWTPTNTVSLKSGSNDIVLTQAGNDFGNTVTVVSGNNVTLVDANALTLGAVTSTGLVDIATETNNLTLSGAIATTNASANAIKLNAGRDAAAGTAAGGNIIISGGTLSPGAGGIATLYTGSVADSTGLTALLGSGSGRFRYNSDEAASNYGTALAAGSNAVYREKPTLTVTPGNLAITYGDATPFATTLSAAYVNGDTSAGALSGTASWTIGGASSTGGKPVVGTHEVTYNSGLLTGLGYGLVDNGVSVNELTVNKKDLNVSGLTAQNKVYDATNTATLGGTAAIIALAGDIVTIGGTATGTFADMNVGDNKAVTVNGNSISGADAGNYNLIQQIGLTANISKANLSVTASDVSKTYGQTPALTAFTTSGLQNGETIGSITLASAGTAATAGVAGAPYAITAADATGGTFASGNYTITYHNGSLTVTPAALSVTASDATKVYGQTPTLTAFSSNGLQNGETIGSVTLASAGTVGTANVVGSPYAITASNATGGTFSSGNYTITYHNGSLTITPAALSVTASDAAKVYGQTPVLTAFTSSGLQNGETIGSVTLNSDGTAATAGVAGSPYAITAADATGGTFAAGNYTITYHDGSLTVTPAAADDIIPSTPIQTPLPQPQLVAGTSNVTTVMPPPAVITLTSSNFTNNSAGTLSTDGITPDGAAQGETSTGRRTVGGNGEGSNSNTFTPSTGITIQLVSQPSSSSTGVIAVAVPKGLTRPGSSFSFPLPEQVSSAVERGGEVRVSLTNGNPLPVWLRYIHETRTFVATDVPAGSMPINAMVAVGSMVWTVEIAEFENL